MDYNPKQTTKAKILAQMKQDIAAIRLSLAEQNDETDGFHVVTNNRQRDVRNTLTKFSQKAGAIFGGIDTNTGQAISRIGYSGHLTTKQKQEIFDLRNSLNINKGKNTLCAEEKIIATTSSFIKFYYACPFYIENSTLYNLEPCGYVRRRVPQSGCKLLLHRQEIKYLTMEEVG